MKKAWCYIRQSDNVGCFSSIRNPTTMDDWIEGYVIEQKRIALDCREYTIFIDVNNEVWYVEFEATISYKHPSFFITKWLQ